MIAYITHWHLGFQMLCSLAISVISVAVLTIFVWQTIKDKRLAAASSVLVSFWFFCTVQWENWLWGWQIEWFMCIAAVLVTLLLVNQFTLRRQSPYLLVLAGVSAIIATFSLGSGILVLPIVLAWLMIKNQKRAYVISWAVFSVLPAAAYYLKYKRPADSTPTVYLLHHPMQVIEYFFVYIGRPMSDNVGLAGAWGGAFFSLLMLTGFLAWNKKAHIEKFLPWVAILAFSMAADCITTISRVGFGLEQAVSSRYTAISLLFIISLLGITATLISVCTKGHQRKLAGLLVAVNIPLLILSNIQGLQGYRDRSAHMGVIKDCTHMPNPTKECLLVTIPGTGVDKKDLDYIKNKHWAGY